MTQDASPTPMTAKPVCLVTRPGADGAALCEIVAALGYRPILAPVLRVEPVHATVDAARFDTVILTSAHAVARAAEMDPDRRWRVFAVGDRTAEQAASLGFRVSVGPGDAEGLIDTILSTGPEDRPKRALHLRGLHSRGDVAARLTRQGLTCEEAVVYQQLAQELGTEAQKVLSGADPVVLPLFSPRSAEIATSGPPPDAACLVIAFSAAVAQSVAWAPDVAVRICERPDMGAMEDELSRAADTGVWVEGPPGGG